jgi:hypothetical protein
MIADPQISTPWELGLFMLAPLTFAIMVGKLLRWKDRRFTERLPLQDAADPKTHAITPMGPAWPPFESVEGSLEVDCDREHSSLQTKIAN